MTAARFAFENIVKLVGHSVSDQEVRNFFGRALGEIERDEFYGSIEFKSAGVDVVFKEAPWVLPPEKVVNPKELYLSAFHLHRHAHEDYAGYSHQMPNGVGFDDDESAIIQKMGVPSQVGGGVMSRVLNRTTPRWLLFQFGELTLHFQFDRLGRVELITLSAPQLHPG